LADILRAEVPQRDAWDADRAGVAFGQERLAGADCAAEKVAHRSGVEPAAEEQIGVFLQTLLGRLLADDEIELVLGLEKLQQPLALPLNQRLLQPAKGILIDTMPRLACLRENDVEIDQAQAVGKFRQL